METGDAVNGDERRCHATIRLWCLDSGRVGGLKRGWVSAPGAGSDSQVGRSVYRYILVLLTIDFIFLSKFPLPFSLTKS